MFLSSCFFNLFSAAAKSCQSQAFERTERLVGLRHRAPTYSRKNVQHTESFFVCFFSAKGIRLHSIIFVLCLFFLLLWRRCFGLGSLLIVVVAVSERLLDFSNLSSQIARERPTLAPSTKRRLLRAAVYWNLGFVAAVHASGSMLIVCP